jgi:hypothetical protein
LAQIPAVSGVHFLGQPRPSSAKADDPVFQRRQR